MGGRGARSGSHSENRSQNDPALNEILAAEKELQARNGADSENGIQMANDFLRDGRFQRVRSRSGLMKIGKDLTRITMGVNRRLAELETMESNQNQTWPEENTYNWAVAAHGSIENYYRSSEKKHDTNEYIKLIRDYHGHRLNQEAIQELKRVQVRLKVFSDQWTKKWDALKA